MRLASNASYVIGVIGVIALTVSTADARTHPNRNHGNNNRLAPYAYGNAYGYSGDFTSRRGPPISRRNGTIPETGAERWQDRGLNYEIGNPY